MNTTYEEIIKSRMSSKSYEKLSALKNTKVMEFVGFFIKHCNPDSVYVCNDSEADIQYVRDQALSLGEEKTLRLPRQTIHWDSYNDQGRDKNNTRFIVYRENLASMEAMNAIEYEQGYNEIMEISKDIMKGKTAIVQFFSEGPTESPFTIPCVQLLLKAKRVRKR